jgi:hypothetical protein
MAAPLWKTVTFVGWRRIFDNKENKENKELWKSL